MTKSEEEAELKKIDEEIAKNPQTPSSLASIPPPVQTTPGGTKRMTIRDYEPGRIDVEAIQRRMLGPYPNVKLKSDDDSKFDNDRYDSAVFNTRPMANRDQVYISSRVRNGEDINLNINVRVCVSAVQDDTIETSTRIQQHRLGPERDTGGGSKQHPVESPNQQLINGSSKWDLLDKSGYVAVISVLSFALGYAICSNMQK